MGTLEAASPENQIRVENRRIRLDLAYDGTHFHGWAAQPGLRTVQGEIESVLSRLSGEDIATTVAGRTDAGVHARHQVLHADIPAHAWARLTPRGLAADREVTEALPRRINKMLAARYGQWARERGLSVPRGTSDVRINRAAVVDSTFDARFSALARRYAYRVSDHPTPLRRFDCVWVDGGLDVSAMNEAAAQLLGEHDFLGYCRPREGATTIRTLRRLECVRDEAGVLTFHVEADAFCHSMVRSLVGALLMVGEGKRECAWPRQILEARSRSQAAPIAPAHGLTLEGVDYPEASQWAQRARQARSRRDGCCGE